MEKSIDNNKIRADRWASRTLAEREFMQALWAIHGKSRDIDISWAVRDIVITPFLGAYGTDGFVIAINGTPPGGMLFAMLGSSESGFIFYMKDSWHPARPLENRSLYSRPETETIKRNKVLYRAVHNLLKERGFLNDRGLIP